MNASSSTHPLHAGDPGEQAAHWLARQDAGLSKTEEAELTRWRAADPRHEAAWQEVMSAWQSFDRPLEQGFAEDMVLELARRQHRRRWKRSIAIAASLTAAAAAIVVMFVRPDPSRGVISRTERRTLEDGSMVELNRGAAIEVNFQSDRRGVRLVRGEALFTVAKNSARPFIVSTAHVDVQAIGTAFAVKSDADMTDVIVTEGKVAVERSTSSIQPVSSQPPVLVGAGDRLLLPAVAPPQEALKVETISSSEMEQLLAWRGARLELAGTRLRDAVALLNRESRVQLRLADDTLGNLRLSGVFRADNAEGFARLLEANYGVVLELKDGVIELRSK